MTKHIKMPKYGLQQDEGTLVRWLKQEGDTIAEGDILCELETDKALFDFEATDAGVLRQILCPEGETVPVLSDIAIITDTADEPIESSGDPTEAPVSPAIEAPSVSAPSAEPDTASQPSTERIRRSPAARKLAGDLDIDLRTVTGTGPTGRITQKDVQAAADALISTAAPAPSAGREPLTKMRKAIGKAMVVAKQTIPHFYLSIDIDTTDVESWWKTAVETDRPDITLTDIIVRAAADALSDYPILNARLEDDDIVYNDHVNVGLAVGTDGGLLVPVIAAAESKSLAEVTRLRSEIVAAARQGKLASEAAATFTISNLGMFGIREFSAIINPPECAALAIGTIRDEVKPSTDPIGFVARRIMTVTLSADHRLVDGLVCARYLQSLKSKLEDTTWL
jgi:pyruvate dehydrogenase E2 component (dihydrolipoamide acetyltransferase)